MGMLEIAGLSIVALVVFGGLAARALEQVKPPHPSMPSPVDNPRAWVGTIVSTPTRFWLYAIAHAALLVAVIDAAAEGGFRSGLIAAAIVVVFQFQLLYALRRLYFEAAGARQGSTVEMG